MQSTESTRRALLGLAAGALVASRSSAESVSGIPTEDPTVRIVDYGPGWIVYQTHDGERWRIEGTCIACGECEVGSSNPDLIWTGKPVGTAGAALDRRFGVRRDIPVRPEISENPHCTLRGRYL